MIPAIRFTLAALCGICLGASHLAGAFYFDRLRLPAPPFLSLFGFPALSILALSALFAIWLLATHSRDLSRRVWAGFLIGTIAGFGYFGTCLYWLGNAFLAPDEEGYTVVAYLGEFAALLVFVPWWSLAMGLAGALRHYSEGILRTALVWTLCMSLADTLLGDIFYNIPLGPISAVIFGSLASSLFSYVGLFGVNFVMLFSAAIGVSCLLRFPGPAVIRSLSAVGWWTLTLTFPALLPTPAIKSLVSGPNAPVIAVAQPAGAQRIRPTFFDRQAWMDDLRRLLADPAAQHSRVVVLPELAIPFDPNLDPSEDLKSLLRIAAPGTTVLYGHYNTVIDSGSDGYYPTTNRMSVTQDGKLVGIYDKAYPVPFGEFMPIPIRWLGFPPFTGTASGLQAGSSISTWSVAPDIPPFAILICYESALSGAVVRETADADWIVNPSSETMLRESLGPALVLLYSRIRALETGKPIYRAAQTGWSAIIDGTGDLVSSIPPLVPGVISAPLPNGRTTVFSIVGYLPLYAAWFIIALAIIFLERRSNRGHK